MKKQTGFIWLKSLIFAQIFLGTMLCLGTLSVSDDFTDRRITAGVKIFRALLAADSEVNKKKNKNGVFLLSLVYDNDLRNAKLAADILHSREDTNIRGIPINPELVLYSDLFSDRRGWTTGFFLTQQLPDEKLVKLIDLAREQGVVLFSPFEGDVERGVMGGIKVEARVQPYLNMQALEDSGIRLKSFFIRVSKIYE